MLRYARKRAGLTQRGLAKVSGIAQPAIARIESGQVSPRIDTLDRLLRSCNMATTVQGALGQGLDRSGIRELLRLTPRERLELAARESANLSLLGI